MRIQQVSTVVVATFIVGACGSSDTSGTPTTEVPVVTTAPVAAAPPAIAQGAVSEGTVDIEGTSLDYVTSVPDGFEVGDETPVLVALPPGGQDLGLARRLVENTYAAEATRLGWVVVSPAAPDGQLFFNGSEALLPGFVDWIETWVDVEGGAPHVAGVSNGGISAFRYAVLNPERVRSIVTFPGFARSADDRAALASLSEIPIRMFVGEDDVSWVDAGEETAGEIEAVGGQVELTVFPGEGHIMSSTADGVLVFEHLESARSR